MRQLFSFIFMEAIRPAVNAGAVQPYYGPFVSANLSGIAPNNIATFTPPITTDSWLIFWDYYLSVTNTNLTQVTLTVQRAGVNIIPFVDLVVPPVNASSAIVEGATGLLEDLPIIFSPNSLPSFLITNNSGAQIDFVRFYLDGISLDGRAISTGQFTHLQNILKAWQYRDARSGL